MIDNGYTGTKRDEVRPPLAQIRSVVNPAHDGRHPAKSVQDREIRNVKGPRGIAPQLFVRQAARETPDRSSPRTAKIERRTEACRLRTLSLLHPQPLLNYFTRTHEPPKQRYYTRKIPKRACHFQGLLARPFLPDAAQILPFSVVTRGTTAVLEHRETTTAGSILPPDSQNVCRDKKHSVRRERTPPERVSCLLLPRGHAIAAPWPAPSCR